MSESSVHRANDDAMRSPLNVAISVGIAGLVCLLPQISHVRALLGVDSFDVALSMGTFAVIMIGGAIVYHRVGPGSRGFAIWDRIETTLVQTAVLMLVYASGRGDSFFWILALVHIMLVGNYATNARFNMGVFSALPLALATAFLVGRGDPSAAALCVMIGALGVYIYWLALTVGRKLERADRERARLAAELAEARVHEDRQRIARDIHDGIGADLAALDWRLRGLREQSGTSPALGAEVDELAGRLAQGTDDLRSIVWALRTPERQWSDLVAYVRQRAAELCGDAIALTVDDGGDGGITTRPGELALDYVRGILELVRNATRHARATHIAIELRSLPARLEATITDDGAGLAADVTARTEGGLANLRHRCARTGGTLQITDRAPGTRIELTLGAG